MFLKKSALCLATLAGLAGCASGPAVQPSLPNSLTVQFNNDATGMMTMRGGFLYTYANTQCDGEARQANKVSMASEEVLTTIPVTPGAPLTFSLTTLNAQGLKGNWGCSVTTTFTPADGARYHAILQTQNDNAVCNILIEDQNKNAVATTDPEYSCTKTLSGIVKNGQAYFFRP